MRQKLYVRNIVDGDYNPAGGTVLGVGIDITWQDGPLREAPKPEVEKGCDQEHPKCGDPHDAVPSVYRGNAPAPEAPKHNGAFVEGVISAAVSRLKFYQASRFECDENAQALTHLRAALVALDSRTARRVQDGTEGTHNGN